MAARMQTRLLIRHQGRIYRVFTFWLEDSDGSFYVKLVRQGGSDCHWHGVLHPGDTEVKWVRGDDSHRLKAKRISYHASGAIIYHESDIPTIYGDPIFDVQQPFQFALHSVPSLDKLDVYDKSVIDSDVVVDAPDDVCGRVNFGCILAPSDWIFPGQFSIRACYDRLFSFHVSIDSNPLPVPKELAETFILYAPTTGLHSSQVIDKEAALLKFHQKNQGTKDLIGYFNKGVYELIFAVPMACLPTVTIQFEDPSLRADFFEITRVRLRFRVKDRYGNWVKDQRRIVRIELEANP